MGIPRSLDAKRYYRAAYRRFDDAQLLLEYDHGTGAIYLAGDGIECMWKALVLESIANVDPMELMTHSLDALKDRYRAKGGSLPGNISEAMTFVRTWKPDIRYDPKEVDPDDDADFLDSAATIMKWIDGRL